MRKVVALCRSWYLLLLRLFHLVLNTVEKDFDYGRGKMLIVIVARAFNPGSSISSKYL